MEKPKLIKELGLLFPTINSKKKARYAIYECPLCGKEFKTQMPPVNRGRTVSCGCYNRAIILAKHTIHGMCSTKLYHVWRSMKRRCHDNDIRFYRSYSSRGITVCDEWLHDFQAFYDWAVRSGYQEKLVIDRINNEDGYKPDNCRWTTYSINNQNTRLIHCTNTSGYRGVYVHRDKWAACCTLNKKHYNLGRFCTKEQAAQAYNGFVIKNKTQHPLNTIPLLTNQ